jgi:hypothetical protein
VGRRLEEVMSDGSIDEDPVVTEIREFSIRVGTLEVDELVEETPVAIVAAVVIVAPTRVVVAWPRVMGVFSVSHMVKLYVPQLASMEPVPQIVEFANPPTFISYFVQEG